MAHGVELQTAVVAAMEEEVAVLRGKLLRGRAATTTAAKITCGWLQSTPVALVVTGDGERNARRGLAALMATLPVRRAIFVGVAGGLSVNLNPGALVVCERVVDEAGGPAHLADPALADAASLLRGALRGVTVSAGRIADTADDKKRLLTIATSKTADQDWSPPLASVVDLESAAFAGASARAGVPWVVLRAVSDTAAESVPRLLNQCRDDGGAVRRARVVRALLTDPRALGALLALRERVRTCAGVLAEAVEGLLALLRTDEADASVAIGSRAGAGNVAIRREV